jgi:hypothetical protein
MKDEDKTYYADAWLCEKSESAIKEAIELIRLLKNNIPDIKPYKDNDKAPPSIQKMTLKDEIDEAFQGLLWDLTKIYSSANGAHWDADDRDLILNYLYEGLEELQVKYGILNKTKKQEKQESYENFITRLKELLNGERSPNRTFLHELFNSNRTVIDINTIQGRMLIRIENELEDVTQGDLSWEDFVGKANEYIKML